MNTIKESYNNKLDNGKDGKNKQAFAKEPMNALTHFIGIILSVIGTIVLLHKSIKINEALYVLAFGIYGLSAIMLYTASTVYHTVRSTPEIEEVLRKIDHTMVFVLIAGTYTPICLLMLNATSGGRRGLLLLVGVWIIVILGMLFKFFFLNAPRWLYTMLYLAAGWLALLIIVPLYHTLTTTGFICLFLGGVFYTLGAVIYGLKNPKIGNELFGFHEIFHIFVLLGSITHFIMMLTFF